MVKQVSIVAVFLVLCLFVTVCVADIHLYDGDATFTLRNIPTSGLDGPAEADLVPYTGAPDYLYETWWHYRLVDDTREYAISNPTSESYVGNTATLGFIYTDFDLTLTYQLTEGPGPRPSDPDGDLFLYEYQWRKSGFGLLLLRRHRQWRTRPRLGRGRLPAFWIGHHRPFDGCCGAV